MLKMSDSSLRAMIASQHTDAMSAANASKLSNARSDAMAYYNGDMSKDMPSAPGRSSAVSMDVADTIEGIMPQLMEVFAGTDEVVKFEPVGPEDVQAAEQETDYINHVFMNQNPGFLVLYSFIKDALLSKVGVVKVWWEKEEREERETYLDKTPDEYAMIVANTDVEVIQHSEHPDPNAPPVQPGFEDQPKPVLHDVVVSIKKTHAQARVMGVPPEEFGIERGARNIRDCNYCFHKVVDRTESDLIAQGYDKAEVKKLPSYRAWTNTEETNRDTVDENANAGSDESNTAARLVEVTEHYVRMDYEGDGRACLYRVTTGGSQGEILKRDGKPDIEEFDAIPFAAVTPVPVTHRFYGRSLADLVMDIQKIKTALTRGLLDNAYLSLNPRAVVAETLASDNTLDDLLVSRPGGIVRAKQQGAVEWQEVPNISAGIYPALEYFDATREWRTGVTRQGQGIDSNALQNQSATAVNQAFTASQARVRLIARIMAETGIRDLFWLLHGLIKKHGQQAQAVRLKNNWVTVDPREWKSREDLTIHVGLGTGGKAQRLAELSIIAGAQEKLVQGGYTNIVKAEQLYSTGKEMTKAIGMPNVDSFFADPTAKGPDGQLLNPPPAPQPDPKLIELQAKNEIEKTQAQADIATQDRKTAAEMALADRKFELDSRLALEVHAMKREEHQMQMAGLIVKHATQPQKTDEAGNVSGPDPQMIQTILAHMQPKPHKPSGMRIVRDAQGRVSHTEPMDG